MPNTTPQTGPTSTGKIAFQGELGAYSHEACRQARPGMEAVPMAGILAGFVIEGGWGKDTLIGSAAADRLAIERLAEEWRDLARATVARKSAALRRFLDMMMQHAARAA